MTDQERNALNVVARRVLHDMTHAASECWDSYPDIGENDWREVLKRVAALAPAPHATVYSDAYNVLATRAEVDA